MEEALARSRAAGDETTQAWALYILGVAAWYHHRAPAQTIVLFRASQALFQEICEMAGLLLALNSLADVMRFQGNNVQSLKLYKQTLVQVQVLGGYRRINVFALAGLGGLFGLQGKPGPAARLLGAAEDAYKSERQHFPLNDQARIASDVASARAQLGEVAFARAWSEGKAMTLEQATAYALDQLADIGSQID